MTRQIKNIPLGVFVPKKKSHTHFYAAVIRQKTREKKERIQRWAIFIFLFLVVSWVVPGCAFAYLATWGK